MKIFVIVGGKNNGKTTLMTHLIRSLTERGYSVSTVKHAHHAFDVDRPGKDSHRHREAGAREVLVSSGARWALMHELRDEAEPQLDDLIPRLEPVDILLIEGFKQHGHMKLEVVLKGRGDPLIAQSDSNVVAVASNDPDLAAPEALPLLPLDAPEVIADFILRQTGLRPEVTS
jgi:molybdopterin-guanine dinucleotide biosynthesis protein MobB